MDHTVVWLILNLTLHCSSGVVPLLAPIVYILKVNTYIYTKWRLVNVFTSISILHAVQHNRISMPPASHYSMIHNNTVHIASIFVHSNVNL
jgi:hypothetical protein